jgi:dTDP-4-dehydrorhamnose reductase
MKIIVTGSSGFLGSTIFSKFSSKHEVVGINHSHGPATRLDIRDKEQVIEFLKKKRPDAVIHTAAMRNDLVETDHKEGYGVNVEGTKNIATGCKNIGAFMVYVSTDLVFDGSKGNYSEVDVPSPLSYYGQTKALAEQTVREVLQDVCIARTSLLYGWYKKRPNFAMLVINYLRENKPFEAISDQYVTPSYVENVVDMLIELCERRLAGTYHTAGASRLTRFDFAVQIADVFSLNHKLIKPIPVSQVAWGTKRGKDCSLDVSLITKILEAKPLSSLDGIRAMKSSEQH